MRGGERGGEGGSGERVGSGRQGTFELNSSVGHKGVGKGGILRGQELFVKGKEKRDSDQLGYG